MSTNPLELHCGDCLALMREMPANSVDLIATDPPYYKVKGEAWDNQWSTPAAFLAWFDLLAEQWQRILRPNGSLYVQIGIRVAAALDALNARGVIHRDVKPTRGIQTPRPGRARVRSPSSRWSGGQPRCLPMRLGSRRTALQGGALLGEISGPSWHHDWLSWSGAGRGEICRPPARRRIDRDEVLH